MCANTFLSCFTVFAGISNAAYFLDENENSSGKVAFQLIHVNQKVISQSLLII